ANTSEVEQRVHHSFTVSPETFVQACKVFHEKKIPIVELHYQQRVTSRAVSSIFTILAATDSSCAIRAGNKECQSLRSRKSCAREIPGLSRRSLRFSVHLAGV